MSALNPDDDREVAGRGICPHCDGSGMGRTEYDVCRSCSGTGEIVEFFEERDWSFYEEDRLEMELYAK